MVLRHNSITKPKDLKTSRGSATVRMKEKGEHEKRQTSRRKRDGRERVRGAGAKIRSKKKGRMRKVIERRERRGWQLEQIK